MISLLITAPANLEFSYSSNWRLPSMRRLLFETCLPILSPTMSLPSLTSRMGFPPSSPTCQRSVNNSIEMSPGLILCSMIGISLNSPRLLGVASAPKDSLDINCSKGKRKTATSRGHISELPLEVILSVRSTIYCCSRFSQTKFYRVTLLVFRMFWRYGLPDTNLLYMIMETVLQSSRYFFFPS